MYCWQEQREQEDWNVVEAEAAEEEKENSDLTLESLRRQTKVEISDLTLAASSDSPCGG